MTDPVRLDSRQMASFVARGFLRFDAVVPDGLNRAFLHAVGHVDEIGSPREHYRKVMQGSAIPLVEAGTPLKEAWPDDSVLGRIMDLPVVRGAIESLVGENPIFDHHFLHMTFPPAFHERDHSAHVSQPTHQDSTIDPRRAFDIQIMYFPHDVTRDMGGTRFIPGTHLRVVSEAAVGRIQNMRGQQHMVCEAGTLLFLHMGIWHGGGLNRSDRIRTMYKVRLCPAEKQVRLWDDSDLPDHHFRQRPVFWTGGRQSPDDLHSILMAPEPWFEADTGRLELMNRIRLWRYLLGDETMDVDYWLTRVENEFD